MKDDLWEVLPTGVQKSYFMLSDAERKVLNTALEKYRPGQSEPILVGDKKMLKPALRLMVYYRLKIEEVIDGQAVTSYTRWVDGVHVRGAENAMTPKTIEIQGTGKGRNETSRQYR